MINKISEFEKKIKVKLNNKSLLVKALTHKSANMNLNNVQITSPTPKDYLKIARRRRAKKIDYFLPKPPKNRNPQNPQNPYLGSTIPTRGWGVVWPTKELAFLEAKLRNWGIFASQRRFFCTCGSPIAFSTLETVCLDNRTRRDVNREVMKFSTDFGWFG